MSQTWTWTDHKFRCRGCGRLSRASQESIDNYKYDGNALTDAEIGEGFEYCLGCAGGFNGESPEGEHVAECHGAQGINGEPTCAGAKPRRYWWRSTDDEGEDHDWHPCVYCEDCYQQANYPDIQIWRGDSIEAPAPVDITPSDVRALTDLFAAAWPIGNGNATAAAIIDAATPVLRKLQKARQI